MLRSSFVSSHLTLLTLLIVLSSLIFFNASVLSASSEQQALKNIVNEIAGLQNPNLPNFIQTVIERIVGWVKTLDVEQSGEVNQESKNTGKRKHDEVSTSSDENIGFEPIVKQFLSAMKMFVEQFFFSLLQDNITMTYTLPLTINNCLNKLDRCLSFKRPYLVDALKIFKNLIMSSVHLFGPGSLAISTILIFATQFELFLQFFESEDGPNSGDLQRLWFIHYQMVVPAMIDNIRPIHPGRFTIVQFHTTKVKQISEWQSKVKYLFKKTKESHLFAGSLEQQMMTFDRYFRSIQKESIKFWVYTHLFLSKVLHQMTLIQTDIPLLNSLETLINIFNIGICTMIRSPNFLALYKMQDLLPVHHSQLKILDRFVHSLGVLFRLIETSSILFDGSLITESAIQNIHHCIEELKSRLESDCISYSSLLARMLPKMNNIPDSSFSSRLNELVEIFDRLAETISLDEIQTFIEKMKAIVANMEKRIEKYANQLKNSNNNKLFFIDVSEFSVKDCEIWKPLDIHLLKTLDYVIKQLFSSSEPNSNVATEIQSKIDALKTKVTTIVQKLEPDECTFDQVLDILNHSKNLIEIIAGCVESNQLTKFYSKLENTLVALAE